MPLLDHFHPPLRGPRRWVGYRPVPVQNQQRIEAWPDVLTLGPSLTVLPLWLRVDLSVPLQLEETYATTREGLRIVAP